MTFNTVASGKLSGRAISLIAVIVLHAFVFYVLANATSLSIIRIATILHTRIIPFDKPKEPPLPPPSAPQMKLDSSIIQVTPPEIKIAIPMIDSAPMQNVIEQLTDTIYENPAPLKAEQPAGPITEPRPISKRYGLDRYPEKSKRAGETGRAEIMMCISPTGTVDSVKVVVSTGFPRLDQAALSMAKDYRFKPAMRQGKPIAVCRRHGFAFGIGSLPNTPRVIAPHMSSVDSEHVTPKVQQPDGSGIDPVARPVSIQTYLDTLKQAGVDCQPRQLRVIGQEVVDKRYVIEAQCPEQPDGLVAFIPLDNNTKKVEIINCTAAAERQIGCEYTVR